MDDDVHKVDVAIVGAGLSGLSAAWVLAGKSDVSFVVLEAMDRVGGRTLIHPIGPNAYVEKGGTWAGPTQKAILALAAELGIATKNGKPEGKTFYGNRGQWSQVDAETNPSAEQQDFSEALACFGALSETVVTTAPWSTPGAHALDSKTAGQWIRENTRTEGGRALFEGCIRKMQGGDPDEVSLLWILHFVATASFRDLLDTAEDFRFIGGSQTISLEIARRLGDRVRTNSQVTRIVRNPDGGVTLEGDTFAPVTARRAIVTSMPAALRSVKFDPPLPDAQRDMIESWTPMSWVKFNAVYDKPFWRGKVVGSQFLCLDRRVEAFDISPVDESFGEIVGFLLPDFSDRQSGDMAAYAKRFLEEVYGPGAGEPRSFAIHDWNAEPRVGGCVSSLKPGLLTRIGPALSDPVGPIHFAGTERSSAWVNYMEGAVQSGQSVAGRVLGELAPSNRQQVVPA